MNNQESRRKTYYYIGAAVILVGLIALLWFRYQATQNIIRTLDSQTLEKREKAAGQLLAKGILADVLPAQRPARRQRAARALRALAQRSQDKDLRDKAIAQLVQMLKDPDDDVQHETWVALGKIGAPALPFLRHRDRKNKDKDYSVLKEGDARAKKAGMGALVMMAADARNDGDQAALDRILSVLGLAAADTDERAAADAVLGDLLIGAEPAKVKVPEALEPLMKMAWSKTVDNRKAALVAMGERYIPEVAAPALDALETDALKQAAIRALGNIGTLDRPPQEVEQAVAPIMAELDDPVLRTDAARALGKIRDARAVPALASALSDPDQEYWDAAVGALASLVTAPPPAGNVTLQALVAALRSDDPRRREGAAEALIGADKASTVGPLVAALRDTSAAVRARAAEALGWENNTAAIQPLIALLAREQDYRVADLAIESLGNIGQAAIKPLIATFARRRDNEALPLYGERALIAIRDAQEATHPEVGRILEGELIAATRNQNLDIAKWAAITLGDLGHSERAADALRRLESSREEEMAWVAKEALREMGEIE